MTVQNSRLSLASCAVELEVSKAAKVQASAQPWDQRASIRTRSGKNREVGHENSVREVWDQEKDAVMKMEKEDARMRIWQD
jgi:hypothetical protein